jgi:putative transposase
MTKQHRTYKYRIYPTKAQRTALNATLSLCCELYNAALQERRDAWKKQKKSISYFDQTKQITLFKQDRPEFKDISSYVLENILKRVDLAFQSLFRRARLGQKSGFPRFHSWKNYNSITFRQNGFELKENNYLRLSKIGDVFINLHRQIEGVVKTCSIKRDGEKWFATFVVEQDVEIPAHSSPEQIGIDLGLESFATLSNGEQIENPRYFRKTEKHLARTQRRWQKKKSKKNKRAIQNAHRKVRNQRNDFLHKVSNKLVKSYSLISVENLNIKGLAKSKLGKSVHDVGCGKFIQLLHYKAESASCKVIEINPKYTSQTCPKCGDVKKKKLSERWHNCDCGFSTHRDHAASLNILALGQQSVGLLP